MISQLTVPNHRAISADGCADGCIHLMIVLIFVRWATSFRISVSFRHFLLSKTSRKRARRSDVRPTMCCVTYEERSTATLNFGGRATGGRRFWKLLMALRARVLYEDYARS